MSNPATRRLVNFHPAVDADLPRNEMLPIAPIMTSDITFVGDPHGRWKRIIADLQRTEPDDVVILGDLDLEEPLDRVTAPLRRLGTRVSWIHGNHDTDRETYHDNLFGSAGWLHGRVVEIGGLRIAGLGGVFRQGVWHPKAEDGVARHRTREEWLAANRRGSWRDGISLRHRSTIFPEDYETLADLRADILVSHEAPSCHRYGFEEIDVLAEAMGVCAIVHGHHHESYTASLDSGIAVFGLAKEELLNSSDPAFAEALRRRSLHGRVQP